MEWHQDAGSDVTSPQSRELWQASKKETGHAHKDRCIQALAAAEQLVWRGQKEPDLQGETPGLLAGVINEGTVQTRVQVKPASKRKAFQASQLSKGVLIIEVNGKGR